ELAAIAEKAYGGPALVFENVKGFSIPVVSNLFSKGRLARLFDTRPEDLPERLIQAVRGTIRNPMPPQVVATGPCKEVVIRDGIDLNALLPIPWATSRDCGNYLGASLIICKEPETGERIMFWARGTVRSPEKLHLGVVGTRRFVGFYRKAEALKLPFEVALCLGVDPAWGVAAAAHGPFIESIGGEYKFLLASTLAGRPAEMVACETLDLEVPANAEIVIEIESYPGLRERDDSDNPTGILGPLATGYYAPSAKTPVYRVKAVTHRRDPLYYAAFGRPDYPIVNVMQEASVLNAARGVAHKQVQAVCHRHVMTAIQFKKESSVDDGVPKNVLMAALGADRDCHFAVVVDEDIDVNDTWAVVYAIMTRARLDKGVIMVPQARGHANIPVAREQGGLVDKVGIDATIPFGMKGAFERVKYADVDISKLLPGFAERPWFEH
ncbi:MAG: UbiD family decarboxylase, partial [Chloroflexi bacterium]|nr:UbiD family decarboxylase [Chloroflexota bacterium]